MCELRAAGAYPVKDVLIGEGLGFAKEEAPARIAFQQTGDPHPNRSLSAAMGGSCAPTGGRRGTTTSLPQGIDDSD